MKSTFFIVADRGHLKAFRAEKLPTGRPAHLELVSAQDLTEGASHLGEKLEDSAGSFRVETGGAGAKGGSSGQHQNSGSEKHYDQEYGRRVTKELARKISELLQQEKSPAWALAAPAELKNAVLEELRPEERKTLVESVSGDLVKLPLAELAAHFTCLGAA